MSGLNHILRIMSNRYRERRTVTLDTRTWEALQRLVDAKLFRFSSRAIDVAVTELVERYEREGKLSLPQKKGVDPDE